MCGRYGGPADQAVSAGHFDVDKNPFGPTQTINPTVRHKVLAKNSQGVVAAIEARWGLIPHWYTGFESEWKGSTFNARVEEIETKPTFKLPWLKKRRIIAPAAHFFEWSGPKGRKKKYKISRADGQPFGMAGLWDHARRIDGPVLSYTVMTKEPGKDVAPVHDREPCFLEPEQWEAWLLGADMDTCQLIVEVIEAFAFGQQLVLETHDGRTGARKLFPSCFCREPCRLQHGGDCRSTSRAVVDQELNYDVSHVSHCLIY